jgi:hypothetical protein
MAGGILSFIATQGGYAPVVATQFSEALLAGDAEALRLRGAFRQRNETTRNMGLQYCDAYISVNTLNYMNAVGRAKADGTTFLDRKFDGVGGTYFYKWLAGGVEFRFHVSDAMDDDEILYIPDPSQVKLFVYRMYEYDEELSGGDNQKKMACVTWSAEVRKPWTLGYRTGLTTN